MNWLNNQTHEYKSRTRHISESNGFLNTHTHTWASYFEILTSHGQNLRESALIRPVLARCLPTFCHLYLASSTSYPPKTTTTKIHPNTSSSTTLIYSYLILNDYAKPHHNSRKNLTYSKFPSPTKIWEGYLTRNYNKTYKKDLCNDGSWSIGYRSLECIVCYWRRRHRLQTQIDILENVNPNTIKW